MCPKHLTCFVQSVLPLHFLLREHRPLSARSLGVPYPTRARAGVGRGLSGTDGLFGWSLHIHTQRLAHLCKEPRDFNAKEARWPFHEHGAGGSERPQLPPAGGGVDSKPTATPRSLRQSSANAPRTWEAATEAGREPHLKRGTARSAGGRRGRGPCGAAAAPPAPRTRPVHDGNRIRPLPEKSRFQCSTLLFFQRQYFYDAIQSGACSAVVRLGRAVGC